MSSKFLLGLGLPLAVTLAACGDSFGPDRTDFDPNQIEAAVGEMVQSFESSEQAIVSVQLAAEAMEAGGASLSLVPSANGLVAFTPVPGTDANLSIGALPIFPSNFLGKTLVYDVNEDKYVIDANLTGAPLDGVRFIYYAINPATKKPVEPLIPLGYLDLTDESSAQSLSIGLLLVDNVGNSPTTLLDYAISASYSVATSSVTAHLVAEGFLSDGTETLDFDLGYSLTLTEGLQQIGFGVDHTLELPSRDLALHFEAEGALSGESENPLTIAGALSTANGDNSTVLEFALDPEALEGTVVHNDDTIVLIGGTGENPTFTDEDGNPLTAAEVHALGVLWATVGAIWEFAESIFHPFADV